MRSRPPKLVAAALAAACAGVLALQGFAAQPPSGDYPESRKEDKVDEYHGVKVPDPYRWLEDSDTDETRSWIGDQNKLTFAFLDKIAERPQINRRLTKLWDYERYGIPFERGGLYFYSRNDGLQNQNVYYVMDSLEGNPRVLIDPNKLSKDGTVALSGLSVSWDGKLVAYSTSDAGSDWQQWKVRETAKGRDLDDRLDWVKFSGASWTRDNAGFFYSRFDEPEEGAELTDLNYYQKLYYHRIGTPQSKDKLVYERKDQKEWGFYGQTTEDGRYLIINVTQGTDERNRVFYKDLKAEGSKVVELLNDFDANYSFIGNEGSLFWFRTDQEAARGRIIGIDTGNPARSAWKEIVPEAVETLTSVQLLNNQFIAEYLKDAHSQIKVFGLDGAPVREIDLPGLGSASGFTGDRDDTETFYSFSSYTAPDTIYRHDLKTGKSTIFKRPEVDFDSGTYETRQVFYTSKDGTRVPLFITHRKGLVMDGTNPTYLYGYGGFNIPMTPKFSVTLAVWMEMGGVVAVANLRGGGEYGEEWHQAGMKLNKQNVFDDFIAAAEWLIENKVTSSPKLAIAGGSNGGLLVGACMTQRPELFAAALPAAGVLDMLRFEQFTIGWAWVSDYGSVKNPEEFKAMYAYSPIHNVKPGVKYPATLITAADHDDRVVPAHSFKFAAALQSAHRGDNPVLIRIETRAGHGAGKPTTKKIEEAGDQLSFLAEVLEIDVKSAEPEEVREGGR